MLISYGWMIMKTFRKGKIVNLFFTPHIKKLPSLKCKPQPTVMIIHFYQNGSIYYILQFLIKDNSKLIKKKSSQCYYQQFFTKGTSTSVVHKTPRFYWPVAYPYHKVIKLVFVIFVYYSFITQLEAVLLTEHVHQKVCIMSFIWHEIRMTVSPLTIRLLFWK